MGIVPKRLRANTVVRAALAALLLACACGGASGQDPDGGAGAQFDAVVANDAASEFPLAGFGNISGDCDVLDDELVAAEPSLIRAAIDFQRLYQDADEDMLSAGAQQIIADGNAGGSSILSEVFAFEVLKRCESATLLKTENQIVYDTQGKITDFLAEIDAEKIGVSVTRAVGFPFEDPYLPSQAADLLQGKLSDILVSTMNVSDEDRWQKQILAILAYAPGHGDVIQEAWMGLDAATRADTVVLLIVTDGADDFIYCDGVCP